MRVTLTILFLLFACVEGFSQTYTVNEILQKQDERYYEKNGNSGASVRDDRPNIIFILLDDARWDSYTVNGGQPFFPTPNIDRIANEGANFKVTCAVLPLCTPSRGVFFTGLYPHKNG